MQLDFDVDTKSGRIAQIFEDFVRLVDDIPAVDYGVACIQEGTPYDPPDIVWGKGSIGIEEVRIVWGEQRGREIFYDLLTLEIQEFYEQNYPSNPPLRVTIHWNERHKATSKDREQIIKETVECVVGLIPKEPNDSVSFDSDGYTSLFNRFHHYVNIYRLETGNKNLWTAGRASFINISEQKLVKTIEGKSNDLHRYRGKFEECWLLITTGGVSRGSYYLSEIAELLPNQPLPQIKTPFDRVYFMTGFRKKVFRLR